jgi:hypothetical protein
MVKSIIVGLSTAVVIVWGFKALADSDTQMGQRGYTKICTLTEEHTTPQYKWVASQGAPTIEYQTEHLCLNEVWVKPGSIVHVDEVDKFLAK